jgi:hypothetical protein
MPTESFPLRSGFLLQEAFISVYFREINVLREVRDTTALDIDLLASSPARTPAASLPGAPEWPFTQVIWAERDTLDSAETYL